MIDHADDSDIAFMISTVKDGVERAPGALGDLVGLARFEADPEKRRALMNAANILQMLTATAIYMLHTHSDPATMEDVIKEMMQKYMSGAFGRIMRDAAKGP